MEELPNIEVTGNTAVVTVTNKGILQLYSLATDLSITGTLSLGIHKVKGNNDEDKNDSEDEDCTM